MRTLQTLFSQKYLSDSISNRIEYLTEQLLNSLKKTTEIESKLITNVTALFFIQLGEPNDELFLQFRDVLLPTVRDESKPSSIRKYFIRTLGLLCFISCEEISTTVELMKTFEQIFSSSYLSSDGTTPILPHDLQELHTASLTSWTLLASTLPNNIAHEILRIYLPTKLPQLIESNDGELRNQAGETLAVLFEIARDIQSIFAEPSEDLLYTLEKKANESAKYKGKKEKRLQRATFREIFNSLEVFRISFDRFNLFF